MHLYPTVLKIVLLSFPLPSDIDQYHALAAKPHVEPSFAFSDPSLGGGAPFTSPPTFAKKIQSDNSSYLVESTSCVSKKMNDSHPLQHIATEKSDYLVESTSCMSQKTNDSHPFEHIATEKSFSGCLFWPLTTAFFNMISL